MILDKKVAGTLDGGRLLLFDGGVSDPAYASALETTAALGDVLDVLFRRAEKLA